MPISKSVAGSADAWHQQNGQIARFLWPVIWHMVAGGLRVIILRRQNLLARSVSVQFACSRGVWHIHNRGEQIRSWQQPAVHIVPATVRREATAIGHMLSRLTWLFPNALQISYEQLADETRSTLGRVQDFLGVPRRVLTSRTQKNSRPWQDRVSNYKELQRQLGTDPRFSPYFE